MHNWLAYLEERYSNIVELSSEANACFGRTDTILTNKRPILQGNHP